jgi:hypothetical protein
MEAVGENAEEDDEQFLKSNLIEMLVMLTDIDDVETHSSHIDMDSEQNGFIRCVIPRCYRCTTSLNKESTVEMLVFESSLKVSVVLRNVK